MAPGSTSALIIFARSPKKGQVKRRLGATVGEENALRFHLACCAHVIPTLVKPLSAKGVRCFIFWTPSLDESPASSSDHPRVPPGETEMVQWMGDMGLHDDVITLHPQIDSQDLGERILSAFEVVSGRGFEKMAIIGTDIPDLTPEIVVSAFDALDSNQAVFSASPDGGYNLVGVKGPIVPSSLFQGISWSTSSVLSQTLAAASSAQVTVAPRDTLPVLEDIDTVQDLCAWYRSKLVQTDSLHLDTVPTETSCSCKELRKWKLADDAQFSESFKKLLETVRDILEEADMLREALSETGYTIG